MYVQHELVFETLPAASGLAAVTKGSTSGGELAGLCGAFSPARTSQRTNEERRRKKPSFFFSARSFAAVGETRNRGGESTRSLFRQVDSPPAKGGAGAKRRGLWNVPFFPSPGNADKLNLISNQAKRNPEQTPPSLSLFFPEFLTRLLFG